MLPLLVAALLATPLHIEAVPPRLELGDASARAVLRITSQVEPRLSASLGAIVNLRRDGPDAWSAEYVPPAEMFPQVALLAAVSAGELAWTALPLWGQGVALVRTRRRARISVDIGGQSFGPVQADEHGQARVPVVVPPGVREVRHHRQRIDLPVPRTPRLHAVFLRESVRADRIEEVAVRVLVTDEAGNRRAGAQLLLRPGRGEVSAPEQRAPGELWATWTLPPGSAGTVRLGAALADAPALAVEAALPVAPGPAAVIELSADRESVVAGEGSEVILRAAARDAAGNASADPLEVSGPAGFGGLVEAAAGEWRLRLPDSFGGRSAVELVAHPRDGDAPRASLTLRLRPAEPVSASIEPGVATVRTGGGQLQLRVLRTDRFGNVVPGDPPAASAQDGSVGALDRLGDGGYLATYLPPERWDREDTVVEMRWPGAAARSRVVLVPRLAPLAVSPKLGALSNFARLTSPVAALEASVRSDRFGPELALSAEVAWYFASRQQGIGQLGTARAREDFFAISAQISLRVRVGVRTTLWAGAGPSLEAVASRLQLGGEPRVSESGLVPGATVSVGVERRFAFAVPFAELRWSWHRDPALSTLSGAVSAVSLLLGNRFELL